MKSLSENENAILESPTGTGKTLALLCSSITWLKTKLLEEEELRLKKEKVEEEYRDCACVISHLVRKRDMLESGKSEENRNSLRTPTSSQWEWVVWFSVGWSLRVMVATMAPMSVRARMESTAQRRMR